MRASRRLLVAGPAFLVACSLASTKGRGGMAVPSGTLPAAFVREACDLIMLESNGTGRSSVVVREQTAPVVSFQGLCAEQVASVDQAIELAGEDERRKTEFLASPVQVGGGTALCSLRGLGTGEKIGEDLLLEFSGVIENDVCPTRSADFGVFARLGRTGIGSRWYWISVDRREAGLKIRDLRFLPVFHM